jgi:hypothetical protein
MRNDKKTMIILIAHAGNDMDHNGNEVIKVKGKERGI